MPQSVPSASEVQATYAATLFDEWSRLGLRDVVLCPGSRSTPLALACTARSELRVHVRIDERSAGFFAIGRALATREPVAIVVTSGTAAAELHACVAEASRANVPLLVLTADRPPELHGVGAPQTIDQHRLFGALVRRFEDPGPARVDAAPTWRELARRLWGAATQDSESGSAGPVHLNAAFIEPLVADALALPATSNAPVIPIARTVNIAGLEDLRVLCVAGHGVSAQVVEDCTSLNWAVVGDATALGTIAYFDALLRDARFAAVVRPDVVVRLGGLPASRMLQERLREWRVRTIGFGGAGFVADPDRIVTDHFVGVPDALREPKADGEYLRLWNEASTQVSAWLAKLDRDDDALHEIAVARCVVDVSARLETALVIGSSMPVRDVEWWTPARSAPTYSNRGVNGIDGVVSTTLGVATGSRAIGLIGDITMLHDVSALVDGIGDEDGTCALVVVDNHGGGIFSFLAQRNAVDDARFERLFATPRSLDLVAIATSFGHRATRVTTRSQLRAALDTALGQGGLSVIVAEVPTRDENVRLHDEWNEKVTSLVEGVQ